MADLRALLDAHGYTTDRIEERLGGGRLSFRDADLAVHERRLHEGEAFSELVRLFLLGLPLARAEATLADAPTLRRLADAGWLEERDGLLRATVKLVPHGDLLVASDRDADGPTGADWVAGIHPPSVTLAKLTVRRPVARALDVATGNGIQALLAARHADSVVATDVNPRALAAAALNARLNGVDTIELRQGSFFEPVAGERFDLVTCNPPYVISPESRYAYRDSGLRGDAVSRSVVQDAAAALADGGFAHVLVSWGHAVADPWSPVESWLADGGCDALVLYFGSDDPVTHASEWLRPVAAEDAREFRRSLARWLDYLEELGIEAVAHGAVVLRRGGGAQPWLRKEHAPLDRLEQASDHLLRLFDTQDRLAGGQSLLDARLALVDRHHLDRRLVCRDGRAELDATTLTLDEGLGFRIAVDEHTAELLPLLDGRPLRDALAVRAEALALDADRLAAAALPAVGRLAELGFLDWRR